MNLADERNRSKFVAMLEKCEPHVDRVLDNWESKFVSDMRERFDARDDMLDMGMTPWNPTVSQWNTLHGIASKL